MLEQILPASTSTSTSYLSPRLTVYVVLMPLTAEAVIALVGVVLAVPPVSVLVWRWRVSVRRAEAIRRALSDTESTLTPPIPTSCLQGGPGGHRTLTRSSASDAGPFRVAVLCGNVARAMCCQCNAGSHSFESRPRQPGPRTPRVSLHGCLPRRHVHAGTTTRFRASLTPVSTVNPTSIYKELE